MLSSLKRIFGSNNNSTEKNNVLVAPIKSSTSDVISQPTLKDVEIIPLPKFKYYPDPVGNQSILEKLAICPCCENARNYMYTGNIYCVDEIEEVCPWCIADGAAAKKWDAGFMESAFSNSVDPKIVEEINSRTPGYTTWQGARWLFSETDAMVFLGDVVGKKLLAEGNGAKIQAVLKTLNEFGNDWKQEDLVHLEFGGQPSVYLFQDRETGAFAAYNDFT